MKRVAILVVSLLVAAGTLLIASPPAVHAATPRDCARGVADAHHRAVNICISEPRRNHFTINGRVFPKYRHKVVILQRKACKGCAWHTFRRDRTTLRGKYVFRGITRLGFYRAKAKASRGFRASFSAIAHIYRV